MFPVSKWGWPQWIVVIDLLLEIGISAARSGEKKKYDTLRVTVIKKIITIAIFAWGGFFNVISWPQAVYIVLSVIDLGFSYRVGGEKTEESLFVTLLGVALVLFLLTMGGFF